VFVFVVLVLGLWWGCFVLVVGGVFFFCAYLPPGARVCFGGLFFLCWFCLVFF